MNPSCFMRIPSCKFHCSSFICFSNSKQSSSSLSASASAVSVVQTSSSLESENEPPSDSPAPDNLPPPSLSCGKEIGDEIEECAEVEIGFKSCIRSGNGGGDGGGRRLADRKKVQWMDNLGKELVDIREFEASESEDDNDEQEGCLCVIA